MSDSFQTIVNIEYNKRRKQWDIVDPFGNHLQEINDLPDWLRIIVILWCLMMKKDFRVHIFNCGNFNKIFLNPSKEGDNWRELEVRVRNARM